MICGDMLSCRVLDLSKLRAAAQESPAPEKIGEPSIKASAPCFFDGKSIYYFRHVDKRLRRENQGENRNLSATTALLVQAFRALGEDQVRSVTLRRLYGRYTKSQLDGMERETRNVTDWIHTRIAELKEMKK